MKNFFKKLFKTKAYKEEQRRLEEQKRLEEEKRYNASINKLNKYIDTLLKECLDNISDDEFTVELINKKNELNSLVEKCCDLRNNYNGIVNILNSYSDYFKNNDEYYKITWNGIKIYEYDYKRECIEKIREDEYFIYKPTTSSILYFLCIPKSITFKKLKYAVEV